MAWLYLPGQAASTSDSSSPSPTTTAPSATRRGKLTPPQRWSRVCKTAPWTTLLSGTTLPPSTADRGAASWISYLAASRARTSAVPDSAPASRADADPRSGGRWLASFGRWSPGTSSWRTSAVSLFGDSTSFSERWPTWGSMRNGVAYRREPWAPRTAVTASSSWPTPNVADPRSSGRHTTTTGVMHPGTTLTDAARDLWATPRVSATRTSRKALTQKHWSAPSLEQMAELSRGELPRELVSEAELTPQACRIYSPASARPTPVVSDWKGAGPLARRKESDDTLATRAERYFHSGLQDPPTATGGAATSPDPRLEPAVRRGADGLAHRVDRLRLTGNGVVPLAAAVAFRTLWARLMGYELEVAA